MNDFNWKQPEQRGASIEFVPVCSNCKHIITDLIDFRSTVTDVLVGSPEKGMEKMLAPNYQIHPYSCPNCKMIFDRIALPTKLPYDNSLFREG